MVDLLYQWSCVQVIQQPLGNFKYLRINWIWRIPLVKCFHQLLNFRQEAIKTLLYPYGSLSQMEYSYKLLYTVYLLL